MNRTPKFHKLLLALHRYVIFFLLIAFVITCCMALFITTMTAAMGITLTSRDITTAAKLTFANVVLLSLIVTAIDAVRHRLMVELPVKRITAAAAEMMRGNFDVRIRVPKAFDGNDAFGEIIECFNKMAGELASTEMLRTDFIANVSHELKTPLAVIQNYATMLSSPASEEEKRLEYAKAITDATRRLSSLISNILKLNKLENQQIILSPETFDLGEQLSECLLGFEHIWEKKHIEIETDIADGILVTADREMMTLLWNNLLSNAFKFTPEGGCVGVSLQGENGFAVTSVRDTGCGISAQVGEHMFEKFYQGDTSHQTEGNGLGLTLVRRIIDITESEISVASELGRGTTFTVKLEMEKHATV
ncbi:MAG: sensor histidine kinase [Clostridia bacterium]|nr:sensor histidine kinase [Clostridia bacterium]